MTGETKSIHIGDILSVMLDRVISHNHVGGIYEVLDWMTGESLFTHQLPRAADVCVPFLKKTFPKLAEITFPEKLIGNPAGIFRWVDQMGEKYGEWHDVPKLPIDNWEHKNALVELSEKIGKDKVILVVKK